MFTKFQKFFQPISKYLIELLIVFVGVYLAFGLSNLNDQEKRNLSETKILTEISNGLLLDLEDLEENLQGHRLGIRINDIFVNLVQGNMINLDTFGAYYSELSRDYISIQNQSGYESLKSVGLDIIEDDELRYDIIRLYDFYYEIIVKLEENYAENQFFENYFQHIHEIIGPYMTYSPNGNLTGIELPLMLPQKEKRLVLGLLWRMKRNRKFTIANYELVREQIHLLIGHIDKELENG